MCVYVVMLENMSAFGFTVVCVRQKRATILGILTAFVWLLVLLVVYVVPGLVLVPMDSVTFLRLIFVV